MNLFPKPPVIPDCAWQRPIGLGWENPYTVRYASNLDDGPWHGMPLGGFGAIADLSTILLFLKSQYECIFSIVIDEKLAIKI
jgi:hypothetical protein